MRRALPVVVSSATLLLAVVLIVQLPSGLKAQPNNDEPGWVLLIMFTFLSLIFSVAGLLLSRRLPRNPVGWSFLVVGLMFVIGLSFEQFVSIEFDRGNRGGVVAGLSWVADVTFQSPAIFTPFLFFFYFFPTGVLPSPRWRWVFRVGLVSGAILFVDFAFRPEKLISAPIENPVGIEALEPFRFALNLAFIPLMVSLFGSVLSLVVRFRRARGVERQQIKWFLTAAAVFALVIATAPVVFWRPEVPQWIWPIALFFALSLIPSSAALAIFRYRLYKIDVVINRTLVYGILTAVLAATYIGLVFGLQVVLSPITAQSDLAIAASTLVVAALFRPVRARVQSFIDRRFYRRKFDVAQTLEDFSTHLRDEVDLSALSSRLTGVVAETMQPAHVSLWLKSNEMAIS